MNVGVEPSAESSPAGRSINEAWIFEWRCRVVRVIALALSIAMCTIVVRGCLLSTRVPWFDLGGVILMAVVAWLSKRRPDWLPLLIWIVLLALLGDVLDGLLPWKQAPISPTHILLPALILYGAILGNTRISALTAVFVFTVYGYTWWRYQPLSALDLEILTNLMMITLCFCLLAVGVRLQHRRFVGAIQRQSADLRSQLDENQRLNAVISHDISNPLSALQATVEIAQVEGRVGPEELSAIGRMAERIANIVRSVRQINADAGHQLKLEAVEVRVLATELTDIFSHRLAEKGQQLALGEGGSLKVATDARMLCCSVLGNLLSNAIKFSARGATIALTAHAEDGHVRLALHNPGGGFPAEVLQQVAEGHSPGSRPGTEAETGAGYGLRIARFYLLRMGGRLEVGNEPGGAVVSLLLPAATR